MTGNAVPSPLSEFSFKIRRNNKDYKIIVKVFHSCDEILQYVNTRVPVNYGVYAMTFIEHPAKSNDYLISEIMFAVNYLSPGIIAHEIAHCCFGMYNTLNNLDFSSSKKEEYYCELIEKIHNHVYRGITHNKLRIIEDFDRFTN